jgi:ubiquinone/menaquinone biosynthesis C-methylase UbiE
MIVISRMGVSERNRELFGGAFGRVYSWYMDREHVARVIARALWGGDIRPFYASMQAIAAVRDGGVIVDAPCGAGVAFRALRPGRPVRYLGFDLSPAMLERARRRAAALALGQVQLAVGDLHALPVEPGSVDLFCSYFGLHCVADPARAVGEMARCLAPQGQVVGGMITSGDSVRHRLLVHPGRGAYGPVGNVRDLRRWFADAGLHARVDVSGLFAYFAAAPQR